MKLAQLTAALLFVLSAQPTAAQYKNPSPSSQIKLGLEKLQTLGSVLYFAAHPDDENTRLIAWLAQEKKYRTAYLSLTRGDGGQNLIGTEQGLDLGAIRTQELLAARRIDKGEQFFSSAYDFGFSKTFQETFEIWDKEQILKEAVYLIRQFRPDVIITRFPPDARGGHGHHQASAIIAREAFEAAADPNRYPEQLQELKPWKAKRLLWNTANFGGQNNTSEDQLKIDIGAYNALIGLSYGELAADSRSQHKSQGFGAAKTRGEAFEYFEFVAGEPAQNQLFDQIETSWFRIVSDTQIPAQIAAINNSYILDKPQLSIPALVELLTAIEGIEDSYWKEVKSKEVKELILACAGISMESLVSQPQYSLGQQVQISHEIISRQAEIPIQVIAIDQYRAESTLAFNQISHFSTHSTYQELTNPYWITKGIEQGRFKINDISVLSEPENSPLSSHITLSIAGKEISFQNPIIYKETDPVRGEWYQNLTIIPKITASSPQQQLMVQYGQKKNLQISFQWNAEQLAGKQSFHVKPIPGWAIQPTEFDLNFSRKGEIQTQEFTLQAVDKNASAERFQLRLAEQPVWQHKHIHYEHIPEIHYFPEIAIPIQAINIQNPIRKIAYLMGAGDLVPNALMELGIEVDIINAAQLQVPLLQKYDALVIGIRAFNMDKSLEEKQAIFTQYLEQGGTIVAQYNVNTNLQSPIYAPYPFKIGRERVTEELAEVRITDPKERSLQYPNQITARDFEGWVQERGLYFAQDIDPRYRSPLAMNDKNEPSQKGSLLIANVGKGKFVYTSISFFRQLPAGVPGAYRLFINLLSK